VLTLSVVVACACLTLIVIMFLGVGVWQKHVISSNKKSINDSVNQLKNTKDLDKVLTVQNQLNTLGSLNDQKPVTSRLFTYLPQITPNNLTISTSTINFDAA